MTETGEYTGERVVDRIPIKTLLLTYNDNESDVLDYLYQNKTYAYSIKGIMMLVFNDEISYSDCRLLLRKMFDKGIIHRHMFINIVYYFNKY